MLKDDNDKIINHEMIKSDFPNTDTFFENLGSVYSIAYSRARDCFNKPIALVRALNKRNKSGSLINFGEDDFAKVVAAGDILGAALSARYAHNRMIAFLDSVTHELLAPVSGVKNTAKFLIGYLQRRTEESFQERTARIMSNIEEILRSAEMSISLVLGLTMFSRSGRMSQSDLNLLPSRLFEHVIKRSINNLTSLMVARRFDRRRITVKDYWKWPKLSIDRKVMEQIFTNLLINSIKYAFDEPESFAIDISMERTSDGNYEIIVSDYGIGIEQDAGNRIFLPGERGERAINKLPTGTGIGLTTVKNLLNIHGMSIELVSFSMPTTFCIKVPKHLIAGG